MAVGRDVQTAAGGPAAASVAVLAVLGLASAALAAEPLPGAAPVAPDLAARLSQANELRGVGHDPRTEHVDAAGRPRFVNRLILERSPYLLQHAHNPVDWFPWGPEAFARARREGRPILLSIGYSTCHWCHVMERESFDDLEIARQINRSFVAIKVDREERPEVDEVYMTALVITAGSGGWPLTTFLTPEGEPFFAGTYFPPERFSKLLEELAEGWRSRRPRLEARAARVVEALSRINAETARAGEVGETAVAAAVEQILASHDSRRGGFSTAPKFPHEPQLLLLLQAALRDGDRRALEAAELTLDRMARGGLYDQIGGGFHRYSTDAEWLVPHFEKMLYNHAHLARAYLEAYRLTGSALFDRVVRQTLDYVLREMTSPEGAFYSATDADSEGREGAFFLWKPAEIRAALPPADAELALRLFDVSEAGDLDGGNVLHLPVSIEETAEREGLAPADLLIALDRIRGNLHAARAGRVPPLRDDKVLTAWNAAMITTLSRAGQVLGEARYGAAAERAAEFLWRRHRDREERLARLSLAGRPSVEATLDDYAYLAEALATLYDATGEAPWLERAGELADEMVETFWDEAGGGFFLSEGDHDGRLPVRPKSVEDLALPSGNSVAVRALAMLAERTGELRYRTRAESTLAGLSHRIGSHPRAFAYLLLAADELEHGVAGPLAYAAGGRVRVAIEAAARGRSSAAGGRGLTLWLEIAPGWHINSSQPLQESLIATELSGAGHLLDRVEYPEAELLHLGFQEEALAVYRGRVPIRAEWRAAEGERPAVARPSLTIQACDDRRCLAPEEVRLELPFAR